METIELKKLIQMGENSTVQFKEKIKSAYGIATEMVAFSNSRGGIIIIGVADKTGEPKGLSFKQLQDYNNLLADAATNNIKPSINIFTETLEVDKKKIIVVTINDGTNKPYSDNKGIYWIKNGSDKRKITASEELQKLLQSSGKIYADELPVEGATLNDLHKDRFGEYVQKVYNRSLEELGVALEQLLENLHLAKNGKLNLAGLLLFSKNPSRFRPAFIIKAVCFFGNFIGDPEYRDSEDIEGDLVRQYEDGMHFLLRNLRKTQQGQGFNTLGILEVSRTALEELLQNAIIHRDYFRDAPIKLLIFDNRIEIINPGCLPNSLTIENIKNGNSAIRNPTIASFAAKILPYRGLGSGIIRALSEQPDIEFYNDIDGEQFKVVIPRPQEG